MTPRDLAALLFSVVDVVLKAEVDRTGTLEAMGHDCPACLATRVNLGWWRSTWQPFDTIG